jgi:hypothetical protein
MSLRFFTGFQGKAATLEVAGITFMVVARNSRQLEQISNYILRESGQTLSPEQQISGLVIQPSVLPKPAKRKTTHE